jgi:hypothetical protein
MLAINSRPLGPSLGADRHLGGGMPTIIGQKPEGWSEVEAPMKHSLA